MHTKIQLEPAYILHSRPFRETSLLLDVFTKEHGIVSLVSRGARSNKSKFKSLLQPFIPLIISYQGKSELMNLTSVESTKGFMNLKGSALLSAFYLNELLLRLLQKMDPHNQLFNIYSETLVNLATNENQQQTLRIFEKKLLQELGYGLQLGFDYVSALPIEKNDLYSFHIEKGFTLDTTKNDKSIQGEVLIALNNEKIDNKFLKPLKLLMRAALLPLLGTQELKSRELFKK